MTLSEHVQERAYERRWWILAVLCLSLFVIVLDNSIMNVALPTIVRELHATNSQLQWMVDAYVLVFAGLLLTAGSLGDRFGRRGALQLGFAVFGVGSLLSALAGSPAQLIAARAFMGIGGAFIMPATLSIITNVFPAHERGRAIGVWAGAAGLGVLGPLVGGALLEHFYWGSVFLVNVPIVVCTLAAGLFLIPTSKDPATPPLDLTGAMLSIIGLTALLYAIIEAPGYGWTDGRILAAFLVGAALLAVFMLWEARVEYPMVNLEFFKNPRFTAASGAITTIFFAMFGSLFLLTQYFQFVLGYSPLGTGVRLVPWALVMLVVSPNAPRLVERVGTKLVVASGMCLVATGLLLMVQFEPGTGYPNVVWRLMVMATGMALTMAPATESIMGSLPLAKAGVGSAINDTTRQVGGALGVAVLGSVASSLYGSHVADAIPPSLPDGVASGVKDSLGFALARTPELAGAARAAFVDGMHAGVLVAAGVALIGALVALFWLPARAPVSHGARAGDAAEPLSALEPVES
jgi:EmrB/QacA subfamily drug resistance transporter